MHEPIQELLDTVRSVLRGLWAHRWLGLITAVVIGVAGAAAVMQIPNRYQATARVYVDTESILKPLMSGLAVQPNIEQQIEMVSRTLVSRPNVERVLRMTDLDLQAQDAAQREALISGITRSFSIGAAGRTNLYSISFRHENPEQARSVVQSFLSIFVESNIGDKRRDSDDAKRFLDEQIRSYEVRLKEAEEQLKEFKLRNLTIMPSISQDAVARSGELQAQLTVARSELSQAEFARNELSRQLAIEPKEIPGQQAIFPYPPVGVGGSGTAGLTRPTQFDARIEAQRQRLDELLLRYTEAHPDVIATKQVLEQLDAARKAELEEMERKAAEAAAAAGAKPGDTTMVPNPVYQQLRVSLAETEARVASLRARAEDIQNQLALLRQRARMVPELEAEFRELTRGYDVAKKNYDALVGRRESAELTGELESSAKMADFRVIDPPRVDSKPVSPNRVQLLVMVLAASMGAGLAIAFLRDQIRPTFYDLRSLRRVTGMPMLGAVSWVSDSASKLRSRLGVVVFTGTAALYVGGFAALLALVAVRSQFI